MRLAIATNEETRDFHPDDAPLLAALRERGVEPVGVVWDAAGIDWTRGPPLLLRTIWNYFLVPDAYFAWLDVLEAAAARVWNPVATLRWNADKGYLAELAASGVPSIPSRRVARGDAAGLAAALRATDADDVVVKPAVSGGAWRTERLARGAGLDAAALRARVADGPLLVQPYVPEVAREGEWSLLYADGVPTHAVLKRPDGGDFRVQQKHGGRLALADAPRALVDAGRGVLDAAAALGHRDLPYARVDGVVVDGTFRLMELEVIEPQLFLVACPAAGAKFADAIVRRLRAA